jgi:uncharacterized protein YjbJ (UPF0337 family)
MQHLRQRAGLAALRAVRHGRGTRLAPHDGGIANGGGSMADDVNGKAKHLGGKIKEGVADLLGDRKMKREGRLAQQEGVAEQDAARATDAFEDAKARELAARRERERSEDL